MIEIGAARPSSPASSGMMIINLNKGGTMLDWMSITDQDINKLQLIMKRCIGKFQGSWIDLEMDITAAHLAGEISLQKLLEFEEADFMHDVHGIRRHIDRSSGKMRDCFLPRSYRAPEKKAQAGFTIAEVMIAMVILGMTLMAVTSMAMTTIKLNTTGNMQTEAINLARDTVEQVRYSFPLDVDNGTFSYDKGPYTVIWTISDHTTDKAKEINVHVSWRRFGKTKYMKIRALFSDEMRDPRSWDGTDWEAWKDQFGVTSLN